MGFGTINDQTKLLANCDMRHVNPIDQVKNIKVPAFFIAGLRDQIVNPS